MRTGPSESVVGVPLRDADADPAAQVQELLAVVADMPKRLDPDHEDHAAALAAWGAGLTALADTAADLDPEAYVDLALAELPAEADEADYLALIQQIVDATDGIDTEMAAGLRAIADVLDPS